MNTLKMGPRLSFGSGCGTSPFCDYSSGDCLRAEASTRLWVSERSFTAHFRTYVVISSTCFHSLVSHTKGMPYILHDEPVGFLGDFFSGIGSGISK